MGHHVLALPPPILQPAAKTERPRWRPRTADTEAAKALQQTLGRKVTPAGGALDEPPHRRPKHAAAAPRRAGAIAQPLADETLRAVLLGQEGILDGSR